MDRRAEHEAVRVLCLFGKVVDRTAEDAFACLGAAAAGDASADGRIADPENFGIDSVRVQRGSDLAQRSVGAAVLMRTAVYKHDFHRESLLIGFLLSYHSFRKNASGTAAQKAAAAFPKPEKRRQNAQSPSTMR